MSSILYSDETAGVTVAWLSCLTSLLNLLRGAGPVTSSPWACTTPPLSHPVASHTLILPSFFPFHSLLQALSTPTFWLVCSLLHTCVFHIPPSSQKFISPLLLIFFPCCHPRWQHFFLFIRTMLEDNTEKTIWLAYVSRSLRLLVNADLTRGHEGVARYL